MIAVLAVQLPSLLQFPAIYCQSFRDIRERLGYILALGVPSGSLGHHSHKLPPLRSLGEGSLEFWKCDLFEAGLGPDPSWLL